jgi:uridine kinase
MDGLTALILFVMMHLRKGFFQNQKLEEMNLFRYIYETSMAKAKNRSQNRIVIGISGAGCIGKTTLSREICRFVGKSECQVVSMDGYMMDRKKRDAIGGLTGYNPDGFELLKAKNELSGLINSNIGFTLFHYNRQTHNRERPEQIVPRRIIIIEGGMSLLSEFNHLQDLRIFLDADHKTQFELRLRREKVEFGFTASQVYNRFEKYFADYQKFIKPQIETANLIYRVSSDYSLAIPHVLQEN